MSQVYKIQNIIVRFFLGINENKFIYANSIQKSKYMIIWIRLIRSTTS